MTQENVTSQFSYKMHSQMMSCFIIASTEKISCSVYKDFFPSGIHWSYIWEAFLSAISV